MKKILLILLLILLLSLPLALVAQSPDFGGLYDDYNGRKGVTAMALSSDLLGMFVNTDSLQFDCAVRVLYGERSEGFSAANMRRLQQQAMQVASAPGYTLLLDAIVEGTVLKLYGKQTGVKGEIKDAILLLVEKREIVVAGIDGILPGTILDKIRQKVD